MVHYKILVVEDEAIVAEDLKSMLAKLGYAVIGIAATGDVALRLTEEKKPDLVLMDIHIQGPMDGIDVAEQIAVQFDIPVTYLTAYADERTLERAKATLPYGYILKPFEERDLRTNIEVALYKHQMMHMLEKMDDWYARALGSVGFGILTIDPNGKIVYMNRVAETLTGRPSMKILGTPLPEIFAESGERSAGQGEATLQTASGSPVRVKYTRTSLQNKAGNGDADAGQVIAFQPL